MKQKIVMKVQMDSEKCRTMAMKIAADTDGVESVSLQGPDKDQVVVVGDGIDTASLVVSLRKKVGHITLLSVEEVKPPKPEEKKMMPVRKGPRTINKKDEEDRKQKLPPEWVVSIDNSLKKGEEYDSGRSWTIYRVPSSLKEIHKKCYIPKIISIGPFHTKDTRLQVMEEHKMRFLMRLLGRLSPRQEDQQNAAVAQSQVVGVVSTNELESVNEDQTAAEEIINEDQTAAETTKVAAQSQVVGVVSTNELEIVNEDQTAAEEIINEDQTAAETTKVAAGAGCGIQLEDLASAMRHLELDTRGCYSEAFDNMNSDAFVRMMVVDGCFVVELLRLYSKSNNEKHKAEDPIFRTRWMLRTLQRDLMMLENQLPFFVLKKLYELTSLFEEPSLIDLTLTFFDPLFSREEENNNNNHVQKKEEQKKEFNHILDVFCSTFISTIKEKITKREEENSNIDHKPRMYNNEEEEQKKEFNHILDVFRSTFISSIKEKITKKEEENNNNNNNEEEEQKKEFNHILDVCSTFISWIKEKITKPGRNQERQLIHCVMGLQEAGVQFKKKERVSKNLLDIDFKKGVLEIPPLYIDDNTVPLFLNFVAYEQCGDKAKPFFSNYFMFFDSLINSPMDVEILHKNGIINHVLGSDKDVANLFNKLGREIVYDLEQCHLSEKMKEVNEHHEAYYATRWHVWWTNLVHDYFSSPWTCLSLFAAIILLLLTFFQTLYTVYPYYH